MSQPQTTLPRIAAHFITGVGIVLFLSYLVYLPLPNLFESEAANHLGLVFYCMATAGAAFVSWGVMLGNLDGSGLGKQHVLKASAIGFALLALMRLGTAFFPHDPFQNLVALPLVEFVVFSVLAFKLYKS